MIALAEQPPPKRPSPRRPLLTLMASGRNDGYRAVSCHPGYFKSEGLLFLLPAGRIRPNAALELWGELSLNA